MSVSNTLQQKAAVCALELKSRNSWKKTAPVAICASIP
eukprot:CAMPEP_0172681268 /NCGR_PEP_ID=MMETSP1074-20121228/17332_1 /TAXON_ID=2916 /ORGANISM="Ceratium fusus, Strain PA161109" /LENGTH=37 /DNA_ID= /DNA_START= /DNA_END= /DNA_ORIENTATION=